MTDHKDTLEHMNTTADLIRANTTQLKENMYRGKQTLFSLSAGLFGDISSLGEKMMHLQKVRYGARSIDFLIRSMVYSIESLAIGAMELLLHYGVEDFEEQFVAEYERAAAKHPGMTLESDSHSDETRFYALAEEVGEVAASLTYDNANSTGHMADTIAETIQVGALALAWLTRFQDKEEN